MSLTDALDAQEKAVFLKALGRYKVYSRARRVAGVSKGRVLRWVREDREFAEAVESAHDGVAAYMRRKHLEAARNEGREAHFWSMERRAHEPEMYSEEGIRLRARDALTADQETEFDTIELEGV